MPRKSGFTLVELLVVIAILGIMFSLLMPAIQASREASRRAQCANNLHQLGVGLINYAESNAGKFPRSNCSSDISADKLWINTMKPYLENVNQIRICPKDMKGPDRHAADLTSYLMNDYVADPDTPGAITNIWKMHSTSKTVALFECAKSLSLTASCYEHVHAYEWFTKTNVSKKKVFDAIRSEVQVDRHGGCSNYLYCDGHVESIADSQIKEWADEGTNFAKPN